MRFDKNIDSVLDEIDSVNPFATYLDDNTLSRVDEWIDTGSYALNAIISGSIYGGIPKGRVTMLAGESMCLTKNQKIRVYRAKTYIDNLHDTKQLREELNKHHLFNKPVGMCATAKSPFGDREVYNMVQEVCELHSFETTIPEIMHNDSVYLVDTPDGYQIIKKFITKPQKPCVRITTAGGNVLECASDHLIEVSVSHTTDDTEEWILAGNVTNKMMIETRDGVEYVQTVESLETQDVYDFEVNHPKHRYWASNISNHNTGKSLFVQKILASAQKEGLIPVIFDTENAVDSKGAARLGLDVSKVKYVPCVSIEQTRNAIYKFLTSIKEKGLEGKFIVAIDSLGNLQSELEIARMGKDSTSADMGTKARAMKSLMQTCTNLGAVTQTTIVCTNHVYDDPSAMFPSIEKHMPGGKSCVYLPSVTVQLARKPVKSDGGKTMDGDTAIGQKKYAGIIIRALTRKNRFIKQYLEAEMYLSFASGLDRYYGMLDLAIGVGAIIQNGATYALEDGTKLGYYKNWRKDMTLWTDTILPIVESRIRDHWEYSNNAEDDVPDEAGDDTTAEDAVE